jgi:signal transduction histidine kinase
LAAILAVAVVSPLALTPAVRAVEQGDSSARVGDSRDLSRSERAEAFDRMADTLARQKSLRWAIIEDVAYELRTPLAILRGSLEAVADWVAEASPNPTVLIPRRSAATRKSR